MLAIAVGAMALPGTDPVTMLIEMVPLLILYEISIVLAAAARQRRHAAGGCRRSLTQHRRPVLSGRRWTTATTPSSRGLLAGLGALAISAAGLACGDDDDGGDSPYGGGATEAASTTSTTDAASAGAGAVAAVEAVDFGFEPNTTTVAAGDTVTWENAGETTHNVKGKGFVSDDMEPGDTFEHEFADAGVYDYLCTLHPDTMTGTVVVE